MTNSLILPWIYGNLHTSSQTSAIKAKHKLFLWLQLNCHCFLMWEFSPAMKITIYVCPSHIHHQGVNLTNMIERVNCSGLVRWLGLLKPHIRACPGFGCQLVPIFPFIPTFFRVVTFIRLNIVTTDLFILHITTECLIFQHAPFVILSGIC